MVWEHFCHESDIGVLGKGKSIEEAFEEAALALTAILTHPKEIEPIEKITIKCQAPDLDLLLIDWLNALIYEISANQLIFSKFKVKISNHHLQGEAWGEKIIQEKHQPAVEAKGATYSQLKVEKDDQGHWIAKCVIDV